MTSDPENAVPESADALHTSESLASPGAQLRRARENAHLTLEDFAAQTKLSRGTLEALEADDFAALLEPVYVRGYYRKCARLLGLSEEALIASYNTRVKQPQPQSPARIRLSAGTVESRGGFAKVLGVLITLIIIGLLGYLWMTRANFEEGGAQTSILSIPPDSAAPLGDGAAVTVSPSPAASSSGPAAVESTNDVAPETAVTAAAPTIAAVPSEPQAAAGGEPNLSLRFRETSWARINDANGRALINGLMDAGSQQVVNGQPPFTVFLGNAPGVELQFNGQRVDLAPFTQSNSTARLNLPPQN